jgi:phage FluMu protein Com
MARRRPPKAEAVAPATADLRCDCGKLVARLTPYGVEVRCTRCKRLLLIPVEPKPDT